MPSKKKKYNARFPAGRIKKIMQTDEEVGKVAQAVPVIISRTLELFVESLLTKSMQITLSRNAKTLTPSHMKQCILSESRFDFLKDLVKDIPDASTQEDNENNALFDSFSNETGRQPSMDTDSVSSIESTSKPQPAQASSSNRTPVIKFGPKVAQERGMKSSNGRRNKDKEKSQSEEISVVIPQLVPASNSTAPASSSVQLKLPADNVPPLIPIAHNFYVQNNSEDSLCIDEDYDN